MMEPLTEIEGGGLRFPYKIAENKWGGAREFNLHVPSVRLVAFAFLMFQRNKWRLVRTKACSMRFYLSCHLHGRVRRDSALHRQVSLIHLDSSTGVSLGHATDHRDIVDKQSTNSAAGAW